MYIFITILIILLGILLGAVVLIQNPKGGGLSGSFGGVGQQLLGARRSSDVIEKLTWGFAAGLLLLCMVSATAIDNSAPASTQTEQTELEKTIGKQGLTPAPAPANAPATNNPAPAATPAPTNP